MFKSMMLTSLISLFSFLGFANLVDGVSPHPVEESSELQNATICIPKDTQTDCIPVRLIFNIFRRVAEFLPGYEEAGLFLIAVLACFNVPALKKIILFFNKKD